MQIQFHRTLLIQGLWKLLLFSVQTVILYCLHVLYMYNVHRVVQAHVHVVVCESICLYVYLYMWLDLQCALCTALPANICFYFSSYNVHVHSILFHVHFSFLISVCLSSVPVLYYISYSIFYRSFVCDPASCQLMRIYISLLLAEDLGNLNVLSVILKHDLYVCT